MGITIRTPRLGCSYEIRDVKPCVECMECRSKRRGVMTTEKEDLGASPWCPIKDLLSQCLFGFHLRTPLIWDGKYLVDASVSSLTSCTLWIL